MTKLSNIDIAYEYLKEKKDLAEFKEIWDVVVQKTNLIDTNQTILMGSLYSSLVCDNRFSLTPSGAWALRNNLKFQDVKKQYNDSSLLKDETLDDFDEEDKTALFYDEEDEEESTQENFDSYVEGDHNFEDLGNL